MLTRPIYQLQKVKTKRKTLNNLHISKLICIFASSIKISWLICRVTSFTHKGESDTKG